MRGASRTPPPTAAPKEWVDDDGTGIVFNVSVDLRARSTLTAASNRGLQRVDHYSGRAPLPAAASDSYAQFLDASDGPSGETGRGQPCYFGRK